MDNYYDDNFLSYNKDLALKALLFSMVFYILVSQFIIQYIKNIIPKTFELEFIQAILFGIIFYLISIHL
jgi:hypothetical protein